MKGPIVIVDAANLLGRAVVEAALSHGWPTIVVSADAAALKVLRERHQGTELLRWPVPRATKRKARR